MAPQVLFSHAEATALLNLVREVFARVRPLRARLVEEAKQLSELGIDPFRLRPVGPEGLSEEQARRRQALHELAGRVDFRSLHEGEVVLLCWEWDEQEISTWHGPEAGYAGRQPIEDPSSFRGGDPA
jgi:hypothetical protein